MCIPTAGNWPGHASPARGSSAALSGEHVRDSWGRFAVRFKTAEEIPVFTDEMIDRSITNQPEQNLIITGCLERRENQLVPQLQGKPSP